MRKVVIVEDEMLAAKRLQRLLTETETEYTILAILDSVKNTAKWLANNEPPDLLFMDIQLGDGLSFEVFEIVDVNCPVIFITAFNEYAIEAFKLNSIAYLLKPIDAKDLAQALAKYKGLGEMFNKLKLKQQVTEMKNSLMEGYKKRFMIKVGEHLKSVDTTDIAYFFSRDKASYLRTFEGRSFLLDHTLEQLCDMLDPLMFFRISRKYVVNLNAINDIISYSNSRLELHLPHQEEKNIIVSRERVKDFKEWLDR
jgi:DNA-binding LytR/AlgR family response regulator